jgi:hypothetical protein
MAAELYRFSGRIASSILSIACSSGWDDASESLWSSEPEPKRSLNGSKRVVEGQVLCRIQRDARASRCGLRRGGHTRLTARESCVKVRPEHVIRQRWKSGPAMLLGHAADRLRYLIAKQSRTMAAARRYRGEGLTSDFRCGRRISFPGASLR